MCRNITNVSLALLGLLVIGTSAVQAAPVLFCKDGPGIDLVNDGCISGSANGYPGGGDGIYSNAGGGDPEADVEAAILGATGSAVDIALYGKSDDNPGLFINTGVGAGASQSGTWDVLDDLIGIAYITIKAANSFALYDVQGANSGTWSTLGILNNGGNQPVVSHISFWTAGGTNDPGDPQTVPVPAPLLLIGSMLLGLASIRGARG